MAANAFLTAVGAYLQSVGLTPAPNTVGAGEPDQAQDLPAVVLSLESVQTAGAGLGERSTLITDGALPCQAAINLSNPVLPEEPSLRLLSEDRRRLALPHGGLVRRDRSLGPLTGNDLTVIVAGASRTVVSGTPGADEVQAEPLLGQLTFGTSLPATGSVAATYFLGQWEQRIARIAGVLKVDVCAAQETPVASLSAAVVEAFERPAAKTDIQRLLSIGLNGLSSIGPREQGVPLRRRTARFTFVFEQEVNRPESSGGIIQRIPVTTRLRVATVAGVTGAVGSAVITVDE
jgi:hypothetical protein